jgi:hypothetical protein
LELDGKDKDPKNSTSFGAPDLPNETNTNNGTHTSEEHHETAPKKEEHEEHEEHEDHSQQENIPEDSRCHCHHAAKAEDELCECNITTEKFTGTTKAIIITVCTLFGSLIILPATVLAIAKYCFGWSITSWGCMFVRRSKKSQKPDLVRVYGIAGGDLPRFRATRAKQARRQNKWYRRYWRHTATWRANLAAKFA